jgi:hypothetical protein
LQTINNAGQCINSCLSVAASIMQQYDSAKSGLDLIDYLIFNLFGCTSSPVMWIDR